MSVLWGQLKAFILTLMLGIVSGGIFHYYQLIIRKTRVGRYWLYLIDFFLWMILLMVVFAFLLLINRAEIRLYVLLALACGILIYLRYILPHTNPALSRLAQVSINLSTGLARVVKSPWMLFTHYYKTRLAKKRTPPPDDNED